ncbi:MAG: hypothetical protein F6J90_38670 [Moorea sp. SIOASIH]|uniref:hypothetical protein n=1 Tax=Moorena sp. SIOASIH TaxID=2607817 RepID=UPI0013BC618C|nr:hypothetical protein [Moorena sp. SIOASIH]NEO41932.1 hypothetical protein [Moorena sp. SIOASIH]
MTVELGTGNRQEVTDLALLFPLSINPSFTSDSPPTAPTAPHCSHCSHTPHTPRAHSPHSLFPIPYSLFPVPCSLFPVPFYQKNIKYKTSEKNSR